MAAARISGAVLRTERRQGTSSSTGKAYDFTEVGVLVGGRDVTPFTVRGNDAARFHAGDVVDVLVDLDVYSGRLQASYVSQWDDSLMGLFGAEKPAPAKV